MRISECWAALLGCLCCFRTKRRSMEKMFIFSGTKWRARNREPVMVHDILSNDISELRDISSLEITAMIHGIKDDEDLLNSTSELCLEEGADVEDLGSQCQVYMEGREVHGTLPSEEMHGSGTREKLADEGYKRKALEETESKSEPSAMGGEQ